nr:hypothetical protein [Phascolarctobacterium faecium]
MVAKQERFASGAAASGRQRGSSPNCTSPAAWCPRKIIMQAAAPADKVAAGRLFAAMLHTDCQTVPLPAHWQITSKLQHKALFKKLQLYALFLGNTAKVPLKCRALNYRAAVGAGTHNLVRKISKQLNRRDRFALGKLLFYCTAAAADAWRAIRGMFI